jgi:hypothetical protein
MPELIPTPAPDEYASNYAGYVSRVAGRDLRAILQQQIDELRVLIAPVSEEEGSTGYAPGKWSIKEVLGHIADTERVMSYRLLRIARGDATPLPGFDQDDYVAVARANERTLESLMTEVAAVRAGTVALVESLGAEAWARRGVSNQHEVSAGALAHIIAGHLEHHVAIFRERYGLGVPRPE